MDTSNSIKDNKNLSPSGSSFFSEEGIITPIEKLNRGLYSGRVERNNLILEVVRLLQPISKYELAKKTSISYSSIKQIIKEFEFCGLVHVRDSIGANSLPMKLIYIKEESDVNATF